MILRKQGPVKEGHFTVALFWRYVMTSTRARRRKGISAAELKRQLQAVKLENQDLKLKLVQGGTPAGGPQAGMETIRDRRPPPVVLKRPGQLEPMEQQIGQDGTVEAGEANDESFLIRPKQSNVEDPEFTEQMQLEQFMREDVTVHIQTVSEKNAQMVFDVCVNGHTVLFKRGETKTVKRYIVEGLARAKPLTYGNEEYIDTDGERKVRWPMQTGLRYPFSVVEDRNPLGASWLQHVLAQP